MGNVFSAEYLNGLLDGAIKLTLSSCRNDGGYEMSAAAFDCKKEELTAKLPDVLGYEGLRTELVPSEKSFFEICTERFGGNRKSRKAIRKLENMLVSEFGPEEGAWRLENDSAIKDLCSGYSGGKAPFYIVSQIFVLVFEKSAVLFIIGSDE